MRDLEGRQCLDWRAIPAFGQRRARPARGVLFGAVRLHRGRRRVGTPAHPVAPFPHGMGLL